MIIYKIYSLLSSRERLFFAIVLIMAIGLSLVEIIGISAIMPFISIASNLSLIHTNHYYNWLYVHLHCTSSLHFIIAFGLVLIAFYIFRGIYSLCFQYMMGRFAFGRYHSLSYRVFTSHLLMSYQDFVKQNGAVIQDRILRDTLYVSMIIQQLLLFIAELMVVLIFYVVLLCFKYKMTLILTAILAIKILFLNKVVSKALRRYGNQRASANKKLAKIVLESIGNFKLIKLLRNQDHLFSDFNQASEEHAKAHVIHSVIEPFPKITLETVGFSILVAFVVYILFKYHDATFVIPIVSLYALALYRMLPAISRVMSSFAAMTFYSAALNDVNTALHYPVVHESDRPIEFRQQIVLEQVSFAYANDLPLVIDKFNLKINKGEKIAFVGESGSGKSTLIDIIIGLYRPISGRILLDTQELTNQNIKSWRGKIGYIPQVIYLFDGTVADNIAFGHTYDKEKIIDCLIKANIYDFLLSKNGIHTLVGDNGIQLSGGQKQRIGIARALYSDPELLVLDEATSALDTDTESKIMDEIYQLSSNKTLLVVAHRLSTVARCDRVITLNHG